MKFPASLFLISLLATGCANFPAGTATEDQPASTAQERTVQTKRQGVRERRVNFGNWRVDCLYEEVNFSTQCTAETYGKITESYGDEIYHPTPVLWISWLKGEPRPTRSVCIFGHDYPVKGVSLQVDSNPPIQLGAQNATGCVIADNNLLQQIRTGRALNVTFLRWPWGQTRATFSLNRSSLALDELARLVAAQ
ncbi:MAG: hypothetical protein WBQ78_03610 [Gammaproteobacteria bacterium]